MEQGRRGDAVALFMASTGMPDAAIAGARSGPGWPTLEAIAPTLAYDDAVLAGGGIPSATARIAVPTLVFSGSASPDVMQDAARATAAAIPGAEHRSLPDQTHALVPEVVAPVLTGFFAPA
ncbi:hypothetical protein GCM10025864_09130 [Luteimicrobium album]|uniref:Alpha/beta hydrolase n=1 Tax=Luteimicrobium album TaxID=1054550 RepID=A0ABQ6HXC0_9MICO|nr:hypothetical protein GCM10025864_09130 [Luteimicrobium album]